MADLFPRTRVGDLPVSRLVIGTNWFLGYSHCTRARDRLIVERFSERGRFAAVLEVFFRNGVNALIASFRKEMFFETENLLDAIKEAEDRTGVGALLIATPTFSTPPETVTRGFDLDEVRRLLDEQVSLGTKIVMPHTDTTDAMVDRCTRRIRWMEQICAEVRNRGMIPGLSTHLPETIVYADETELDVETYIAVYNAAGFLMPLEVDWTCRIIHNARKPVLSIKPLAAGQLRPFQGLTFVWNTLRDRDMVAVGTLTPDEAREVIDLSREILQRRPSVAELQDSRSKAFVKNAGSPF